MIYKTQKLIKAAIFSAIICVATLIIQVPSPLKGNINLGDAAVLLAGLYLSCGYGFMSAAIGSALADVISGYILYAPATFFIKGAMAILMNVLFKLTSKKLNKFIAIILSGLCAEILMIAGYFIFEGFIYGFGTALLNIPFNAIQAGASLAAATVIGCQLKVK